MSHDIGCECQSCEAAAWEKFREDSAKERVRRQKLADDCGITIKELNRLQNVVDGADLPELFRKAEERRERQRKDDEMYRELLANRNAKPLQDLTAPECWAIATRATNGR